MRTIRLAGLPWVCAIGAVIAGCPLPSGSIDCRDGRVPCDGACMDLTSDVLNCGACDRGCPVGAACLEGACMCAEGLTACAGACVDVDSDPMSCSSCGASCDPGSTCCGGACADLDSDPSDCGACGVACEVGMVCVAGACTCQGSMCGGACVNLQADPANCGECGHGCRGEACQSGLCAPRQLTGCQGLYPRDIAVDEQHVYWINNGYPMVWRIPVNGGLADTIDLGSEDTRGEFIAIDDAFVVWSYRELGNWTVVADRKDGSGSIYHAGISVPVKSIVTDPVFIYWIEDLNLVQMAKSGGAPIVLATDMDVPIGLAADGESLYWVSEAGGRVMKVPAAGGIPVTIAEGQPGPSSIAVSGAEVFWTNFVDGTIMAAPLNGGSPTLVTMDQPGIGHIAVDAVHVYWIGSGGIMKAPRTGGSARVITPVTAPFEMALDDDSVYWVQGDGSGPCAVMKIAK